jgi:hypothetical protein
MHGFGHLHRELAGGDEDQDGGALARGRLRPQDVQRRQCERGGLAGAGGCLGEEIAPGQEGRMAATWMGVGSS